MRRPASDRFSLSSKLFFLAAIVFASMAASCPPKSVKQVSLQSLQVSEAALEGAQTIERTLCFNNPVAESGVTCTNPNGVQVGLTKLVGDPDRPGQMIPVHQLISKYFVKAFDLEIKASEALTTWKPGDIPPVTLADYQKEVQSLLMFVQTLLTQTPQTAPLTAKLKAAIIQ